MDVDMSAIKEALDRRRVSQPSMPIANQMSQPGGATPTGGPNTPTARPPQVSAPAAGATLEARSAMGRVANTPNFDDDTRKMAKTLINKLMGVL